MFLSTKISFDAITVYDPLNETFAHSCNGKAFEMQGSNVCSFNMLHIALHFTTGLFPLKSRIWDIFNILNTSTTQDTDETETVVSGKMQNAYLRISL